jgi:transcriptional regulator with XRE-family HTH domain
MALVLDAASADKMIQRMRSRMQLRKYSVSALARRAGISHSTLSLILSGQVKNSSATIMLAIANSLDCDIEYLLAKTDHPRAVQPGNFPLVVILRAETGTVRRTMSGVIERTIEAPLCKKFADRQHFAVEVDDNTMNRADPPFPRGFCALAVDAAGMPVMDGGVYVIRLTKDGGESFETIIRRVNHLNGVTELLAQGDQVDPPRRLAFHLDTDTTKDAFAIGLVYGCLHMNSQFTFR